MSIHGARKVWRQLNREGVDVARCTDLALDALQMAIWRRQRTGADLAGLVHHSDRGVQYRAVRYPQRLAEARPA